jgi:hypothetical protein
LVSLYHPLIKELEGHKSTHKLPGNFMTTFTVMDRVIGCRVGSNENLIRLFFVDSQTFLHLSLNCLSKFNINIPNDISPHQKMMCT